MKNMLGNNPHDHQTKKNFEERIKVSYSINKVLFDYYIDLKDVEKQKRYTFRDLKVDACFKW